MGLLQRILSWRPGTSQRKDNFTPVDAGSRSMFLVGSRIDFGSIVRNGLDSNVVMAPVQWIMRTFPEATPVIETRAKAQWTAVEEHELSEQLAYPNPFYDGTLLAQATIVSWFLDGNAYWLKIRGRFGQVAELWYIPHWLIEPRWPMDGSSFISHYNYRPLGAGAVQELARQNVVHLRFGLDPRNPRLGMSPLRPLMREVFTDEEAANFSAAMLKNMGVPGVVIAPKDSSVRASPDDVAATKEYVKKAFTGDHRGEPMVMGAPTEISQFGFDPSKLMVGAIRDIAEERVCAAIGLPAAVVGFGAGLQQTKVGATMRELRRLAWVQCIIPTQNAMAAQLSTQLLPDYETKPRRYRVRYDSSRVSAFQEEETEKTKRIALKVTSGLQRVDQGQEELGMAPDPGQQIYLRPVNLQAYTPEGEPVGKPATESKEPPPAPADKPPPPPPNDDDLDEET